MFRDLFQRFRDFFQKKWSSKNVKKCLSHFVLPFQKKFSKFLNSEYFWKIIRKYPWETFFEYLSLGGRCYNILKYVIFT